MHTSLPTEEEARIRQERDEAFQREDFGKVLSLTNVLATRSVVSLTAYDIAAQAHALFQEGFRLVAARQDAKNHFAAARSLFRSGIHRAVKEEPTGQKEMSIDCERCCRGLHQLGVDQGVDQLIFRLRRERDERRGHSK